jgi:uncharacterized protein YpmS
MRKLLRLTVCVTGAILAVLIGLGLWTYYSVHQVPEFYAEALEAEPEKLAEASEEMIRRTTELVSNNNTKGNWEAIFTAEQINGFLAVNLPKNHPDVLPKEFRDPRVAITSRGMQVACRYQTKWITTVASLHLEPSLRENNVLAVRFRKARAGTFPLPLKDILDQLTKAAAQAQIRLQWETIEDEPVALITIPAMRDGGKVVVSIDALELRDGAIYFRGRTEPAGSNAVHLREITQLPFHRNHH